MKNSLRILYFTMRDRLEADMNISTPYFLFPDDKSVKGSSSIFMALLGEMQNKKLIAIGVFVRSNSYPRIVALIPQLEQRDADGYMTQPSGLLLIPLPYASEIRSCASTNATQRRTAGQGELAVRL